MKQLLILLFLFSFESFACLKGTHEEGIVPKNNLNIPVQERVATNISRREFFSIIKSVEKLYAPIVMKVTGDRLVIQKKWSDGTVNAYAEKKRHKRIVSMFGGFARHPLVTKDAFMFVVCHEIGHHVGGEPMVHGMRELWASNEGQSDYFAGMKCMRRVLSNDDNVAKIKTMNIPQVVKDKCSQSFVDENERALCQRISMAGFSLASVFRELRRQAKEISFSTPDPKVVFRTWFLHPEPQCRLDTYFQSALCPVDYHLDPNYDDESENFCARSHGDPVGARPLCWYKP